MEHRIDVNNNSDANDDDDKHEDLNGGSLQRSNQREHYLQVDVVASLPNVLLASWLAACLPGFVVAARLCVALQIANNSRRAASVSIRLKTVPMHNNARVPMHKHWLWAMPTSRLRICVVAIFSLLERHFRQTNWERGPICFKARSKQIKATRKLERKRQI